MGSREAAVQATNDATAAAKLKEDAEEKVVAAKNADAAKIQAAADKELKEANAKKAAAEGMIAKIDNAACAKHAGCKGLEGYCCPTLNFAKMHLGSAKLDGESLGCCGGASELEIEEVEEVEAMSTESDHSAQQFGLSSVFLAFVTGSAVSAAVLKASSRQAGNDVYYQNMPAA